MKLSKAIDLFIQDVSVTKARATATAYESDLKRLCGLAEIDSVLRFTPDLVRRYFLLNSSEGKAMSTLHRRQAALRQFAKWCLKHRIVAADPTTILEPIRRPKLLPRPFSQAEVERLLALDLPPHEALLRALLFYTGLRVTPICGIKLGDISEDPPTIRATVKGAKTQVVPMHDTLKDMIVAYVLAHSDLKGQTFLLRQGTSGRPFTRRTIERTTVRWGARAEVPQCVPHRFRHTFATGLLRAGVDVRVIKEMLGHEDIASTMIYTEVSDAAVNAAIRLLPWGKK